MNKHVKNLIALSITVFFTVLVIQNVQLSETIRTFKLFNVKYSLFLVPFFLVIMTLRAKRWQILLPKNNATFTNIYDVYMTSNLLNIFLPARAGDIFRGCFFGHKYNLSKLQTLGTVAAERILDGLTVVFILVFGILFYNRSKDIVEIAITAAALFLFSFIFIVWIYKTNKIETICKTVKDAEFPPKIKQVIVSTVDKIEPLLNSFIQGFNTFADTKTLIKASIYSILSWGGDCLFTYLLILAFGVKVGFSISLFIVSFLALSTIIPSSSIYVGLYQYAFIFAMSLYGINNSKALSIALLHQGIMLVGYIIVAIFFVAKNNISIFELKKKADEVNGKDT